MSDDQLTVRIDERISGLVEVDVMLDGSIRDEFTGLCMKAEQITAIDDESFGNADDVCARIAGLCKAIETNRKTLKRPVLDLGKRIDRACDEVVSALRRQQSRLADMIADYVECKRTLAAKAEIETRRLLAAEPSSSYAAETPTNLNAARAAATLEVPLAEDAPRSSVAIRTVRTVEIENYDLIPHRINGIALMKPDTAVIRKLLDAGVEVPGCRLEFRRSTATRGKR